MRKQQVVRKETVPVNDNDGQALLVGRTEQQRCFLLLGKEENACAGIVGFPVFCGKRSNKLCTVGQVFVLICRNFKENLGMLRGFDVGSLRLPEQEERTAFCFFLELR